MTALSLLERVDPRLPIAALLIVLLAAAVPALLIAARVRSDNKAAARARSVKAVRLPRHMATRMWDFDERGRPW